MGTTDIIARLQLRAEDFSSTSGRAFADLKTRAASTAQEVKTSWTSAFADVQRVTQTALAAPRTSAGSLNLDGEIAALRASAAAAEEKAAAFREMQTAAERSAFVDGVATEKMLLRADSAKIAALAADRDAQAIRGEIASLEVLQGELNRTSSLTGAHGAALVRTAGASGQARMGMQQLSFQLNDVATGFAAGMPPMMIFAQQSGQVVQALSLMGGGAKGLLGVLAGPWGLVMTSAIVVLAPFVAKLWEGGDAADKQKQALETLTGATKALDEATGRLHKSKQQEINDANTATQAHYKEALALRDKLKATLSGYDAELHNPFAAGQAGPGLAIASAYVSSSLATNQKQIDAAEAAQRGAQFSAIVDRVAASTDKAAAANQRYQHSYDQISAAFAKGALDGDKAYAQLLAATKARDAVTKSSRDGAGAANSLSDAQARLAAATNGTQRAEAQLALTRIQTAAAVKAGTMSEAARTSAITAAQSKVYQAQAAEKALAQGRRDSAKATREAEAAEREMQATLDGLVAKYDPVTAAAEKYAKTLRDITDLQSAGKLGKVQTLDLGGGITITPPTAEALKLGVGAVIDATNAETDRLGKAVPQEFLDSFKQIHEQLIDGGKRAGDEFGKAAQSSFREIAETLESVLGLKIGGGASRVLSLLGGSSGKTDPFSQGLQEAFDPIVNAFEGAASKIDSTFASGGSFSKALGQIAGNAGLGAAGGSVFASISGGQDNKLASSLGGAVGGFAGKAVGKALGSSLGKLAGLAGPLGSIAGGILGNVVGGLFKSEKWGSSTIGMDAFGNLTAGAATGHGSQEKAAASAQANSVISGLDQIAQALGGSITGAGSVSLGYRPNHKAPAYRVDTSGSGSVAGPTVQAFATQEEAIRAAIADAIGDGVIAGISDASQRILKSGQDLDAAITKAASIEAIPRDLKAMLDPVGAAVDDLNRKWKDTVEALNEGGASTEQMAQAQQLYALQLAQTKASTATASQALKDFLASLKVGSDSPYSLRDQEKTARSALQPYLDEINSGQSIDQDKFAEAAKSFLDVERSLYGSTQQYFDALDGIQAATNKAIAGIDNVTPISPDVADPFGSQTATNTNTLVDMTQDTNTLLQQAIQLLGQVATNTGGADTSAFIGAARNFLAKAA